MNRTTKITAFAAACLCSFAATAEKVDKTSPASPRGEVEIVNVAGMIHVIGWDKAEVQVTGELGRSVERLEFQHDADRTFIKPILPRNAHGDGDANLTIHVPKESRLITSTVSADQTIEDVYGAQRLQAVSGDIRTQILNSEFEAKTVSGDISASGKTTKEQSNTGHVRVGTVSGDIELTSVVNELDVSTVSGSMVIRSQSLSRASIKTTNGDLQLSAALGHDARVDAEAINGDLTFNLEGMLNAEFDIETFNGEIDNCVGPKAKRKYEHGPGNELRFKEGDGSARVRVKTLNGKVRICGKSGDKRSAALVAPPRSHESMRRLEPLYM